jgi:hypothetical protein
MKCQQESKLRAGAFLTFLIKYNFTRKSRGILGGIKWVYGILPILIIMCKNTKLALQHFVCVRREEMELSKERTPAQAMGQGQRSAGIV